MKNNRFHQILTDDLLFLAFKTYLKHEYASENLEFYVATTDLESTTTQDSIQKKARDIARRFLGIGDDKQEHEATYIHLSPVMVFEIQTDLKKKKIPNTAFSVARLEIECLLKTKYISFCSDPSY